jgi:hypothetical protein
MAPRSPSSSCAAHESLMTHKRESAPHLRVFLQIGAFCPPAVTHIDAAAPLAHIYPAKWHFLPDRSRRTTTHLRSLMTHLGPSVADLPASPCTGAPISANDPASAHASTMGASCGSSTVIAGASNSYPVRESSGKTTTRAPAERWSYPVSVDTAGLDSDSCL